MAAEKQMVPGFNHNVKHGGTPYHVQTEDSGIGNPRIITHLFVGGNVIASKKTSYEDIVGAENLAQVVRELMEEQHKEMLRNLISGVYDGTDQEVAAKARAFQPGQISTQPGGAPVPRPPVPSEPERATAPRSSEAAKVAEVPKAPEPAKAPAPRPPPIPRSSAPNGKQPVVASAQAPEARSARPVTPASPTTSAPRPDRPDPAPRPPAAKAAQAGAPAVAAPAPRPDNVDALFGEDLISEKSLDEVILSYLAEDLAGKP